MPHLFVAPRSQVLLDPVDLCVNAQYQWFIDRNNYVYRLNPENLRINLHYQIGLDMGFDPLSEVGFKDGNQLNLQRSNLFAYPYTPSKNYSSYRGISFDSTRGKWVAQLTFKGQRVLFARYRSEPEAVKGLNRTRVSYGLDPITPPPGLDENWNYLGSNT